MTNKTTDKEQVYYSQEKLVEIFHKASATFKALGAAMNECEKRLDRLESLMGVKTND